MTDYTEVPKFSDLSFTKTPALGGELAEVWYPNDRGVRIMRNVGQVENTEETYTVQELVNSGSTRNVQANLSGLDPAAIDQILTAVFNAPKPEASVLGWMETPRTTALPEKE